MRRTSKTSDTQISLFGGDESTSSPAVSPASHSRRQASAKEPTTSRTQSNLLGLLRRGGGHAQVREPMTLATSGRLCLQQFTKSVPDGSWARTFSELLIGQAGWYSSRCALTWRLKVTKSNRSYFQLVASTLPIAGTEPFFLPTPKMSDTEGGKASNVQIENRRYFRENAKGVRWGVKLKDVVENGLLPTVQTQGLKICENGKTVFLSLPLLPTPVVCLDGVYHDKNPNSKRHSMSIATMAYHGMLPTPRASKITGGDRADFSPSLPGLMLKGMLPTPRANIVNGLDLNNPNIANRQKGNLEEAVSKLLLNGLIPTPTTSSRNGGTAKERERME